MDPIIFTWTISTIRIVQKQDDKKTHWCWIGLWFTKLNVKKDLIMFLEKVRFISSQNFLYSYTSLEYHWIFFTSTALDNKMDCYIDKALQWFVITTLSPHLQLHWVLGVCKECYEKLLLWINNHAFLSFTCYHWAKMNW